MTSTPSGVPVAATAAVDKGLKRNALSFLSNITIGIASTAPAYSLASSLGYISQYATTGAAAILLVSFIPMLLIAVAYYYLNRVDPDCGTTFSWATRAMGPYAGWMGGWAIIVTDILVMPNLASIAGQYSLALLGYEHPAPIAVTLIGVAWIAGMTIICYLGITLSARAQQAMLAIELTILMIFAVAALWQVYGAAPPPGAVHVASRWFDPFAAGQINNFPIAILYAFFIYWGWDCGVSVNEETENATTTPGHAAIVSTVVLVAIYLAVTVAATGFAGPNVLAQQNNDFFTPIGRQVFAGIGIPGLDALLILAILSSAAAATQTTILPTARTVLSMAGAGAVPKRFGEIDRRYLTPGFATVVMGGVSIAWYVGLTMLSANVASDSLLALGIDIAFYYSLTGFACVVYFRRELLKSVKNFLFVGVLPGVGALAMLSLLIMSCFEFDKQGTAAMFLFGVGGPLVIGLGALVLGLVLMAAARYGLPDFFGRTAEVGKLSAAE